VTSRLLEAGPAYIWLLSRTYTVLTNQHKSFLHTLSSLVRTRDRAHPGRTSRSVTHPQISPGQARLTSEFLGDRLPEKKLQLVDMSILSILLSPWAGVSHPHPHKRPTSSSVNPKPRTSSLGHVPYVQCQQPMCHVRASSATVPVPRPCVQCQRRNPDTRALTRHAPVHMPVASAPPRARAHASALTSVRARETARVGSDTSCDVPPPRGRARLHLAAF
jgi:hypothetical protein